MVCPAYASQVSLVSLTSSSFASEELSDGDSTRNSVVSSADPPLAPSKVELGTRIAMLLLELKSQIKIFHWQTVKIGHHYALDNLFNALTAKNDQWVETFQGKYGRIQLPASIETLTMQDSTTQTPRAYLTETISLLLQLIDKRFSTSTDSDLSNIFDEIIGMLWRTNYLLTLE